MISFFDEPYERGHCGLLNWDEFKVDMVFALQSIFLVGLINLDITHSLLWWAVCMIDQSINQLIIQSIDQSVSQWDVWSVLLDLGPPAPLIWQPSPSHMLTQGIEPRKTSAVPAELTRQQTYLYLLVTDSHRQTATSSWWSYWKFLRHRWLCWHQGSQFTMYSPGSIIHLPCLSFSVYTLLYLDVWETTAVILSVVYLFCGVFGKNPRFVDLGLYLWPS